MLNQFGQFSAHLTWLIFFHSFPAIFHVIIFKILHMEIINLVKCFALYSLFDRFIQSFKIKNFMSFLIQIIQFFGA